MTTRCLSLSNLVFLAAVMLVLTGCKATPLSMAEQSAGEPAVTWSGLIGPSGELLPRLDALQASTPKPGVPVFGPNAVAAAVVTRIWLPADDALDQLWHLGSVVRLSGAELRAWHENQLRATLIHGQKLKAFTRQLPAPYGLTQQVITFRSNFIPMDPASPAASHRPATVNIQNQTRRYVDGRMELMIAANSQSNAQVKLTIIPHQYVPKATILPRGPVQAALDGPLFNGLMLRVLMNPGDVLLIAPDLPTPHFDDTRPPAEVPPEASPEASTGAQSGKSAQGHADGTAGASKGTTSSKGGRQQRPTTQPSGQTASASVKHLPAASQPAPLPYGLGRAILTGTRSRTVMHQLWMIQVQPIKTALPADSRYPMRIQEPAPKK